MAQMGFFDLSDRYTSLDAKRDPLVEIDAVVPWEEFRPTLERAWRKPEGERKSWARGKPMDAVVMFKTLVLGALYNLSDDQIKFRSNDRASRITRSSSDTTKAANGSLGISPALARFIRSARAVSIAALRGYRSLLASSRASASV